MSVDYHRHCQITVLSANGTGSENGESWDYISNLRNSLSNLPANWISSFIANKQCITQDFAAILKILNESIGIINTNIDGCIRNIIINNNTYSPTSGGNVSLGSYLPLSGGTLSGFLTLHSNPKLDMHAATKKYVDDQIATRGNGTVTSIKLNGDTKIPNENGLVDLGSILTEFDVRNYDPNGRTISTITLGNTTKYIKIPNDIGAAGGNCNCNFATIYRYQSNPDSNGEYIWFEIWPDGWCRQGGYSNSGLRVDNISRDPSKQIDLPLTMASGNYFCQVSGCLLHGNGSSSPYGGHYLININDNTSVNVAYDHPGSEVSQITPSGKYIPFQWTVEGYRDISVSIESLQSTYTNDNGHWTSSTIGLNGTISESTNCQWCGIGTDSVIKLIGTNPTCGYGKNEAYSNKQPSAVGKSLYYCIGETSDVSKEVSTLPTEPTATEQITIQEDGFIKISSDATTNEEYGQVYIRYQTSTGVWSVIWSRDIGGSREFNTDIIPVCKGTKLWIYAATSRTATSNQHMPYQFNARFVTKGNSTGSTDVNTDSNISVFDPSKFHTVFFNPGYATSIEFTTKSLYEGSKFGRLPTYTMNGVKSNKWYTESECVNEVHDYDEFNSNSDIELHCSNEPNNEDYDIKGIIKYEDGTSSRSEHLLAVRGDYTLTMALDTIYQNIDLPCHILKGISYDRTATKSNFINCILRITGPEEMQIENNDLLLTWNTTETTLTQIVKWTLTISAVSNNTIICAGKKAYVKDGSLVIETI